MLRVADILENSGTDIHQAVGDRGLKQGQENFPPQGQRVNTSGFLGRLQLLNFDVIARNQPQTICTQMDMAVFQHNFTYKTRMWAIC